MRPNRPKRGPGGQAPASVAFVADRVDAIAPASAGRQDQDAGAPSSAASESPIPPALQRPKMRGHRSLVSLREVAGHLGVSVRTVRRLVAARQLSCVRVGSQLRFDPADVFRFVAARKE
jgi:excisionase family DNA binding protein